jgi:hypothetical protein
VLTYTLLVLTCVDGSISIDADVMLYGVSELYKESGNCRLEA